MGMVFFVCYLGEVQLLSVLGELHGLPGGTVVRALRQTWLVLLVVWWATGDHHHPEYSGGNEKDRVTRRVDAQVGPIPPAYLPGESAISAL